MAITLTDAPNDDTQTELASGRSRDRDPQQVKIDGDVAALVAGWNAQGKPAPAQSPAKTYTVLKVERSEAKDMIRKAGRLHKIMPVFFKDAVRKDGRVAIKYTVTAIPAKAAETPAPVAEPTPEVPETAPETAPETERESRGRFAGRR
jgi:uncharacterized protein involved in type VI secretion and phage assembly